MPHAFNSLPIQSDISLLTTLCTASVLTFAISNISTVISNLFYAVSIPLVLLFVLYCTTKSDMAKRVEGKKTLKTAVRNPKDDDKPNVDITYTHSVTPTGSLFVAVFDLLQLSCANLKALYPQTTTKVVDVPEVSPLHKGLKFDRSNNTYNALTGVSSRNSEHFIEGTYTDNGVSRVGIWIPRAPVANATSLGFNITTLGLRLPISATGRSVFVYKNP